MRAVLSRLLATKRSVRIAKSWLMTHPRALWGYRGLRLRIQARRWSRKDKESAIALERWFERQSAHRRKLPGTDLAYLEMVRRHAADGFTPYMVLPLFSYALLLRPERIVELGCSYTYYPETYRRADPWVVSDAMSEGLVSTRLLLAACRFLDAHGVRVTLTSVDLRTADHPLFARNEALLRDLGLAAWWQPAMGVDSVSWLREEEERIRAGSAKLIDLAFVDSNHTYAHVRAELEALRRIMAGRGVMLIDNCYALTYEPGVDSMPGDGAKGISHGGEYGAILDFVGAHPEWSVEWDGSDLAVLKRDGELVPNVSSPESAPPPRLRPPV